MREHRGLALRAQGAVAAEEFVDAFRVEDMATGKFADDGNPVLVVLRTYRAGRLVISRSADGSNAGDG